MKLLAEIDCPEDPTEDLAPRAASASRSAWVTVTVNLALTAIQISTELLAKSQGLIADGVHSLSDLAADFVVLFTSHHVGKDPGAGHSDGTALPAS